MKEYLRWCTNITDFFCMIIFYMIIVGPYGQSSQYRFRKSENTSQRTQLLLPFLPESVLRKKQADQTPLHSFRGETVQLSDLRQKIQRQVVREAAFEEHS